MRAVEIMPVGTMIKLYPIIIMNTDMALPTGVIGTVSPYPVLVSVTIAQYTPWGIDVNPSFLSPSTKYRRAPLTMHMMKTANRNTTILILD